MGLTVKKKEYAAIPLLAEGTYTAVCIGIVDVGEQYNQLYKKLQDELMFTFEVVGETIERGNGLEPRWLSRKYTKSLDERSNLYGDLKKWLGTLTEEDRKSFDVSVLLGKGCLISVEEKEKKDGKVINEISGIAALVKGTPPPTAKSELFLFDMDAPETYPTLNTLPQFVRDRIRDSPTWMRKQAGETEMGMDEDKPAQAGASVPVRTAPEPDEILSEEPGF